MEISLLRKMMCSLFNIYKQALVHRVGPPEELQVSQPSGTGGEFLIRVQLRYREE